MGASKDFKQVNGYSGYVDVSNANSRPRYNNYNKNNQNGYKKYNHNGKKNFKSKHGQKPGYKKPIQNYDYRNSHRDENKDFNRKRVDIFTYCKRAKDGKFVFKVFKYQKFENWALENEKRYFPAFITLHEYNGEIYLFNCNRKLTKDTVADAVKIKTIYEYDDGNIFITTYNGFGYTAEPYLSPKQFKRYYGIK